MNTEANINLKNVEGVKRGDLFHIDPQHLQYDKGFNVRLDYGDIAGLAEDIRLNGVLKPLEVRTQGQQIFVNDGHRRLMAIEMLRKQGYVVESVKCVKESNFTNEVDRILNIVTHNNGKNLSPVEEGIAFRNAMKKDSSLTAKDIANRYGRTVKSVETSLLLTTLPKEVQEQVARQEMPITQALSLIEATTDFSEQREIAQEAVSTAKSSGRKRASTQDMVSAMTKRSIPAPKVKEVQQKKSPSKVKMLQEFYNEGYADHGRRKAFLGINLALEFLSGEIKSVKELEKKMLEL